MCITGAANGIMKAGLAGSQRESSFGLSIGLPLKSPQILSLKVTRNSLFFVIFLHVN